MKNSAYIIVYRNGEKIVRSARVLWDRGYAACICNVMILPKYQRKGIDSKMIKEIISYLNSQLENNWKIMITLAATKEKEIFQKPIF